jgi:general secretion pathway protein J
MRHGLTSRGFTLIEILIAITLVGLLTVAMALSIRLALNSQARADAKLFDNRRMMGAERAIEQELNNFIPVSAIWMPPEGGAARKVPFFEGASQTMRFISSYSLTEAHRGLPQILEFLVIRGAEGAGLRLVVNEIPYHDPFTAGLRIQGFESVPNTNLQRAVFYPIEVGARSFVIADRLSYCRLFYQGIVGVPPHREWMDEWPGRDFPLAVRIDLTPVENDPSRLHPVSVTAALRSERSEQTRYDPDDPIY